MADTEIEDAKNYEGFDRVFPLIGGRHRYQWFVLMVTALQGVLAFHHMGYAFLGAVPRHWCQVEDLLDSGWTEEQIRNISIPREIKSNGKVKYEECSYYDLNYKLLKSASSFESAFESVNFEMAEQKRCYKWTYDKSIFLSTVVTEFDLVCDHKYLAAMIQVSYMGGVFTGSLVSGALSDNLLGRRGTILIAIVLEIIGGFGAAFSTSYFMFVFSRFITAVGVAASFQNCFTLVMEYSDSYYRGIVSFIQQIPFGIFYMIMALYAYFFREWNNLQLSFSVTTLVLCSYYWILPESSRWLASKNRDDEAVKILENIARTNRKPKPNREALITILQGCRNQVLENGSQSNKDPFLDSALKNLKLIGTSYVNLVRTAELRKRSLILWYSMMSVNLVYYGISFASPTLSDDPFIIVFLGGLVEIPAYLGIIPVASRWGRKPALIGTFLGAGIFCASAGFMPSDWTWLRIAFSMAGKLFITANFAVIYLVGTELYPTTQRATGLGIAVLMGRAGSILAPYVATMKTVYTDLPTLVFGGAALFASLAVMLIPETRGEELLDNMKSVEYQQAKIRSSSLHEQELKAALRKASLRKDSMKSASRKTSVANTNDTNSTKV